MVVLSNGIFFCITCDCWCISIHPWSLWCYDSVNFSLWIHFWSRRLWGWLLFCPGTSTHIWCCHWGVILEEATWWEVLSFSWYVKLRLLLSLALLKITSVSCQTFHFPMKLILKIKDCVWDITEPIMVALFALPSLHNCYFTYHFCQDLYYKIQFYSVLYHKAAYVTLTPLSRVRLLREILYHLVIYIHIRLLRK